MVFETERGISRKSPFLYNGPRGKRLRIFSRYFSQPSQIRWSNRFCKEYSVLSQFKRVTDGRNCDPNSGAFRTQRSLKIETTFIQLCGGNLGWRVERMDCNCLLAMVACCHVRKLSAVSAMTSSTVNKFASGDGVTSSDYASGRDGDVDEVIYVEGPHAEGRDHVELSAVEVYGSSADIISTVASRQFPIISTTTAHQTWIKSGTSGHGFGERTSSELTSTTTVVSDNESAPVKSKDVEDRGGSTQRYLALAVNVALLAGIIFVVAVFLAVLVSFIVHRRRQRHQNATSTPTSTSAPVVSRPRIKPAYYDFSAASKPATISPPASMPRLFVSMSRVGDPKEWFV